MARKKVTPPETAVEPAETQPEPKPHFPIVGIGASAGGLAAFEAFFSGMPADKNPDMAFVLVQHLSPDHSSILTDLIRRYTRMQVFEATDGVVVRPNSVYVIPPNCDMAFLNGSLHLLEPGSPHGQRLPIDFFFRSLAQDQHERAICIVLSGTASDGTHGLKAVKEEGGMAMAQSPESAEFDGMPRSAIASGLVDYILPAAEMPAKLISYTAHAFGNVARLFSPTHPKAESSLKRIFILLRAKTGHDFSQYKPSTIYRRIERRMAVHQIKAIEGYVKYLQQTPVEVEALFRDLLIGVTSFFRDPEAFRMIEEQIIPKLFAGKSSDAVIRVWSAGCSTGEEAYSLAILLAERQMAMNRSFKVQVFATDIDSQAIVTGRVGIYPANIADNLSPERLARFFVAESNGSLYRIHKGIRDMLVFSEQDVVKDPPFSKVDLISCRNLLIYMGAELQKKLLSLFHYALNPGGFLFLGTSESASELGTLFVQLDSKLKVYQRKDNSFGETRAAPTRFMQPMTAIEVGQPQANVNKEFSPKLQLRELAEQALLEQVIQAGALVNRKGDILYLHGRTGMYLEPALGEVGVYNILKMAREGLLMDLTTALHKAASHKEVVRRQGLRVKTNGHFTTVNLSVSPVTANPATKAEDSLYLVILEESPFQPATFSQSGAETILPYGADIVGDATDTSGFDRQTADRCIATLRQELRAKAEYIQATIEEMNATNEELKSTSEELQSLNEEMQSTNEELETSREELQSVNEELCTVNTELQTKVLDLSRINNDINNLLSGTGIGTIFVDFQLRILRFTPTVTRIINLIPSDIGRSVGHFVSNLIGYDRLVADVRSVLDTLSPKELEVQTKGDGKYYTMRILPYRTIDNDVEGAVINFVDITEQKLLEMEVEDAREYAENIVETVREPLMVLNSDLKVLSVNQSFYDTFKVTPKETIGNFIYDLGNRQWDIPKLRILFEEIIPQNTVFNGYEVVHDFQGIGRKIILLNARQILRKIAGTQIILLAFEDITERKQVEEALRKANDLLRLAVVVRDSHDAVVLQDMEGRIMAWNPAASRMYRWSESEALQMNIRELIPEELRESDLKRVQKLSRNDVLEPYRTQRITKDGTIVEVWLTATAMVNEAGQVYAIATSERASGIE